MSLDDAAPDEVRRIVRDVGQGFREAVGLPLELPAPSAWEGWFRDAGLADVVAEKIGSTYPIGEFMRAAGGIRGVSRMLYATLTAFLTSKRLRSQSIKIGRVKDLMLSNRKTRRFISAVLVAGRKPGRD